MLFVLLSLLSEQLFRFRPSAHSSMFTPTIAISASALWHTTDTSFLKICKQRMLHLGKRRLTLFADRMKVAWQRAVAAAQEAKERLTVQPRPPEHPAEFTLNTTCVNKWYIIKYVAPSWVHTEYGMREHRIFISKYVAPSWRVSRILCNIFHLSWGRNIQKFWQRENDF